MYADSQRIMGNTAAVLLLLAVGAAGMGEVYAAMDGVR